MEIQNTYIRDIYNKYFILEAKLKTINNAIHKLNIEIKYLSVEIIAIDNLLIRRNKNIFLKIKYNYNYDFIKKYCCQICLNKSVFEIIIE